MASFMVHLLMREGVYMVKLPKKDQSEPIEFELIHSPKPQQHVTETHSADNTRSLVDSLYLSKFQKQFKKQSKAKKSGLTKNRTASTQGIGPGDLGASTVLDDIPNVKHGSITALNTNRGFFYTYYNRIGEQVGNRWQNKVSSTISSLNQKGLKKYSRKPQSSVLEILLTPEGHFYKAKLIKSAQLKLLDEISLSSFKNSLPFLNPPKGLVGADGFVHLSYSFRVDLSPYRIVRQRQ